MIKAIVIDDEPKAVHNLVGLIEKNCPEVEVMAGITEAKGAHETIIGMNPDLVFLDIEMPQQNGFGLLERVGQADFAVIFTTAYDQRALRAIKCSALDYLLKPIDAGELKAAVAKFDRSFRQKTRARDLSNLSESPQALELKRLAVPDHKGISFISVADLICLEASRNYTVIHRQGEKPIVSTRTLKDYEILLHDMRFYRVHYSHLVNLRHVQRYEREGYLLLTDGHRVEVARRRKNELLALLCL